MKAYSTVLFDLDNTLVLTDKLLNLRKQRKWNDVLDNLDKTNLPHGTKRLIDIITNRYGMKVGVVTRAKKKYATALLEHHRLPIDTVVANDDVRHSKPDPEGIYIAAKKTWSTISRVYIHRRS